VRTLGTTGCQDREHEPFTHDDRGGIAVNGHQVFYNGDGAGTLPTPATGRFDTANLANPATLSGAGHDGLAQNLRGQVWVLMDAGGTEPTGTALASSFTVTQLGQFDSTGVLGTGRLQLATPITVHNGAGIFSGVDRLVIWTGPSADGHVYNITLDGAAPAAVADLGFMANPAHVGCENWAFWGISEFFNDTLYVSYVESATTIRRIRVPDGQPQNATTFASLGDMCSFTFSPRRSRWYFHHEGPSQFAPAALGGTEHIGSCAATWDQNGSGCDAPATLCVGDGTCHVLQSDDLNCGACGTACASGNCMHSLAGPPVTSICSASPPVNDTLANATALGNIPNNLTATAVVTGSGNNSGNHCGGPGQEVFYSFNITSAMGAQIVYADTLGSPFDTVLFFLDSTGNLIPSTTLPNGVVCNDDIGTTPYGCPGSNNSIIAASLAVGSYYLGVGSFYAVAAGSASVRLQRLPMGNAGASPNVAYLNAGTSQSITTPVMTGSGTIGGGGCATAGAEYTLWWVACSNFVAANSTADTCGLTTLDTLVQQYSPTRVPMVQNDNSGCGTAQAYLTTSIPAGAGIHTWYLDLCGATGGSYTARVTRP